MIHLSAAVGAMGCFDCFCDGTTVTHPECQISVHVRAAIGAYNQAQISTAAGSAPRPSQITIRGGRPVARQLPGAMSPSTNADGNLAAPEHLTQHQHDSPAPHPRRHRPSLRNALGIKNDPHLAFILIRSYEKMMASRSPKASTPKTTTATGDLPSSISPVESDRDDLSVAGVQPFIEEKELEVLEKRHSDLWLNEKRANNLEDSV
uniref:Uncharacterized protein n=1 Tax=Knipowitschia caucasica TaxID=637954 RepID=A0AAV2LLP2_KNICA